MRDFASVDHAALDGNHTRHRPAFPGPAYREVRPPIARVHFDVCPDEPANLATPVSPVNVLPVSRALVVEAVLGQHIGQDQLGVVGLETLKLETVFGQVRIAVPHIRELRVSLAGQALPPGDGTLAFGGVNWLPWRTAFAVEGDKLVTLPKARPGFQYGHGGNGRGGPS